MAYEKIDFKTGQVLTADALNHMQEGIAKAMESGGGITLTTYADLVSLRDAGQLKPGTFYRITDYVTTTTQENTQSAGHQFDIIVLALSESKLSEQAYAAIHEGDTYFTENGANLSAWKVWYCLDNNTERFAWADAENGKGVIYRMIDEWNNDLPYDFKNIQFEQNNVFVFTFSDSNNSDDSCVSAYGNIISSKVTNNIQQLNKNLFGKGCYSNTFGNDCYSNTFGDNCSRNTLGDDCYSNTFGDGCSRNTLGDDCYSNTFGDGCSRNTFGDNCYSNTFGDGCYSNTFGDGCYNSDLGKYCTENTIGREGSSITFGERCSNNICGGSVSDITFDAGCISNTCGNFVSYLTLGAGCRINTIMYGCEEIYLGNYYSNIVIGNNCAYLTLANEETASANNPVRNYSIASGINDENTSGEIQVIRGREYETVVALNSDGDLKMFNLADLA